MRITCAMIAPYAELAGDGKVSVMSGDLDTLRIQGDQAGPLPLPLYLIVKVAVPADEAKSEYQSRVELIDSNDEVLEAFNQVVPAKPPAAPGRQIKLGILLVLGGLTFPSGGSYAFRILIDAQELMTLPFYVELHPSQGGVGQ